VGFLVGGSEELWVGAFDGIEVGLVVGFEVHTGAFFTVGARVGMEAGFNVNVGPVAFCVGATDGIWVGMVVALWVGAVVGCTVGTCV